MLPHPLIQRIRTRCVREWGQAKFLYDSPTLTGDPEERHLAEVMSQLPTVTPILVDLLDHRNPLVAAYSLMALGIMDSPALADLPQALLVRTDKLTRVHGSFSHHTDLGSVARKVHQRWLARHPRSTPQVDLKVSTEPL